jgi:copper(I)-binding protein
MPKLVLEFAAAIALTLTAIIALSTGALASDVTVKDAFARASATPTAKTGAIYLTLASPGGDRLIAVFSPAAAMAHIHESKDENGVMKMEMLESLDLAAGSETVMAPGGLHIMLTGLKAPLKKGESLPLELTFEKAGVVSLMVPVGGVADQAVGSSGD